MPFGRPRSGSRGPLPAPGKQQQAGAANGCRRVVLDFDGWHGRPSAGCASADGPRVEDLLLFKFLELLFEGLDLFRKLLFRLFLIGVALRPQVVLLLLEVLDLVVHRRKYLVGLLDLRQRLGQVLIFGGAALQILLALAVDSFGVVLRELQGLAEVLMYGMDVLSRLAALLPRVMVQRPSSPDARPSRWIHGPCAGNCRSSDGRRCYYRGD